MALAIRRRFEEVNRQLWLILSIGLIAAIMDVVVTSQHMVLVFYTLPTTVAAYLYGRRYATLTALGTALLIGVLTYLNPELLNRTSALPVTVRQWLDLSIWAGILIITGYLVGTLCEIKNAQIRELRTTYYGVLEILRHFISNDKYTENHSYRVSIYGTRIAEYLSFKPEEVEDIRAAGLLHDIGKLELSKELLHKAARLTLEEYQDVQTHVEVGGRMLVSVGGSLRRVLPIVLAHHERHDGKGYNEVAGESIPLAARVLAVADVYDSLTSDRPYRKAMSSFEAKAIIVASAGKEFDPTVVSAFVSAFEEGRMEIPPIIV